MLVVTFTQIKFVTHKTNNHETYLIAFYPLTFILYI